MRRRAVWLFNAAVFVVVSDEVSLFVSHDETLFSRKAFLQIFCFISDFRALVSCSINNTVKCGQFERDSLEFLHNSKK